MGHVRLKGIASTFVAFKCTRRITKNTWIIQPRSSERSLGRGGFEYSLICQSFHAGENMRKVEGLFSFSLYVEAPPERDTFFRLRWGINESRIYFLDDGEGNENGKQPTGLDWQNNNFARASRFLYISLSSLHDYNVKVPKFTFCRWGEHETTMFFFFQSIQCQRNLPKSDEFIEMK